MKHKLFSLLLVLAVMLTSMTAVFAAADDKGNAAEAEANTTTQQTADKSPFNDLAADHVHYDAIKYLTDKKVIDGYEDGSFKAENTITRAEFVKMLSVFAGWDKLSTSGITGFSDVDAKDKDSNPHWASTYIKIAVDNKIVNGMGNGTFAPDAPVKYEQVMKMLVCFLGYEEIAKNAAELEKKELWPDGYLIQGNKLLISKNATLAVGDDAPRSAVAQMIYNIKDTKKYMPIVTTGSGSGGPSGPGNVGDRMTKWERIENGMPTSEVKLAGHIVAAVKELADGTKITTCIDANAKDLLSNNTRPEFFVAKCDREFNGSPYFVFKGTGSGYTDIIGHEVDITFDFEDDTFILTKLVYNDRQYNTIETIDAEWIDVARTKEKIAGGTNCLVYRDPETERFAEMPMPADFSGIHVMYNNILVGSETIDVPDGNGGTVQQPTAVTINDFIISEGSIRFVTNANSGKSFNSGEYDVIFLDGYDTYVAKASLTPGSPRKLVDKYRKDKDGNPLSVNIYEKGENGTVLEIRKSNETSSSTVYTLANISANSIIKMKRSLGGRYTYLEFYSKADSRQVVSEFDANYLYLGANYKEYKLSDYYKQYVASTVNIEKDISVTPYLNSKGEIVWLSVAALSFTTGYIMSSEYENTIGSDASLKINYITTGATGSKKTATVTKNTKFNGVACSQLSDPELGTGIDYVYNALIKHAKTINEGKSITSAEDRDKRTCQPFMFNLSGSNLTHIKTMDVDAENRHTNANSKELTYYSPGSGSKQFKDSNNNTVYTLSTSSVIIMVPDERTDYGASAYSMGSTSSLSSKLINNHHYYVEPFYRETTGADGSVGRARDVFVVYYEQPQKTPRYYDNNVVVKELKLDPTTQLYKLTVLSGTQGSGSTSFTVYCPSGQPVDNSLLAYVLDENFERMKDSDGNYIKRKVAPGDVVRFGKLPDNRIVNLEIVFDISENIAERKYGLYTANKKLDIEDFADFELVTQAFSQVGLVRDFDHTADDITISLVLGDNAKANGSFYTKNSAKVYAYDFTIEETDKFSKELTTIRDINYMTDMVYVNQVYKSGSLTTSYIYVVRYDEDLQAKYTQHKNDLANPPAPTDLSAVSDTQSNNEVSAETEPEFTAETTLDDSLETAPTQEDVASEDTVSEEPAEEPVSEEETIPETPAEDVILI